jgi:hypothetical protein
MALRDDVATMLGGATQRTSGSRGDFANVLLDQSPAGFDRIEVSGTRRLYARVSSSVVAIGLLANDSVHDVPVDRRARQPPFFAKAATEPKSRCRSTQRYNVRFATEKRSAISA